DISANGNLIIDGTSILTGNITAGGDLEIQGGNLTTNQSAFSLLNTIATSVSAFGDATTVSIGAATGTTTVNNNLSVSGNLATSGNFDQTGTGTFTTGTGAVTLNGATSVSGAN